jgi:hypothetical protein
MAYLPDSCTLVNTIPFVTVLDINLDLLFLDPSAGPPTKPLLRQVKAENCGNTVALRGCLDEVSLQEIMHMWGKRFFKRNEGMELFRITAPGMDRTKSAFKRRFSCCIKLTRSSNYIGPHRTLVFITDYPANDQFALMTCNTLDSEGTPMSVLEDVCAASSRI